MLRKRRLEVEYKISWACNEATANVIISESSEFIDRFKRGSNSAAAASTFLILSKFLDAVITIQITIKYDLFLLDVETFFGNSGIKKIIFRRRIVAKQNGISGLATLKSCSRWQHVSFLALLL